VAIFLDDMCFCVVDEISGCGGSLLLDRETESLMQVYRPKIGENLPKFFENLIN